MEEIREKDRQMAKDMTDYLNGSCNKKEFCRAMNREHRYLQEEFTYLCIEWLRYCASPDFQYDGRNEHSMYYAKNLMEKGLL